MLEFQVVATRKISSFILQQEIKHPHSPHSHCLLVEKHPHSPLIHQLIETKRQTKRLHIPHTHRLLEKQPHSLLIHRLVVETKHPHIQHSHRIVIMHPHCPFNHRHQVITKKHLRNLCQQMTINLF